MTAMKKLSRTDAAPWASRGPMFSQAGLARPVAWSTPHDLDRLRASHARGRLGKPLVPTSVASPRLGDELFGRLLAYGTPQETHPGDVLFTPGDEDVNLIVVGRVRRRSSGRRRLTYPRRSSRSWMQAALSAN